jgi:hypothetical protein
VPCAQGVSRKEYAIRRAFAGVWRFVLSYTKNYNDKFSCTKEKVGGGYEKDEEFIFGYIRDFHFAFRRLFFFLVRRLWQ